jgi:hypothetical protein
VLLVGAASTKNEGILAAVVALFMAGVVVFRDRPRRALRELALAAGVFLVMIAPWQVWAAQAGVPKDVNAADGLNPLYLAKHLDRAWPAFKTLQAQLVDQSKWSWFLPLAIVVIATAIVVRTATRAAMFYALTGLGVYAALVWAYWASLYPIDLYLAQSAFRVVDGLGAVAMVALAHIGARLGTTAFAGDLPAGPPDGEVAALERGERDEAPDKRSLAPAGLLAFWRA